MAGAKKKEILFVFEGRKAKSQRARELEIAAIRSHAARNAKRRKQTESEASASSVRIEDLEVNQPSPASPIQRPARLPPIPVLLKGPAAKSRNRPGKAGQTEELDGKWSEAPSALSLLGQGRVDPFGTCFTASLPDHILKYLDYAYEIVWPPTLPLTREKLATWWWRRNPFIEPHAVDHHVAAAASLALKYDPTPAIIDDAIKIRAHHRQKSIAWINEEVSSASGPPADRVIMAVIALIVHTGERNVYSYQTYRQTPLATGNSIHIFGGCNLLPEDLRFLCKLVELKGGMEGVESVAVRSALTFIDVIFATRHGCPPALRLEKDFADLAGPRPSDLGHSQSSPPLKDLGAGFNFIQDHALLQVLQACCELTVDLEYFQWRMPSSPSFGYLVHRRLGIQHALCSLHFPVESEGGSFSNIVRLAALLYSDIVLFAMPPAAGVRARLLGELRKALERQTEFALAGERHDAWLWAVFMGAVGSIMKGEKSSWFAGVLQQQSSHAPIHFSLPRMKGILTRFLWWEYIMDAPASDVWALVQPAMEGSSPDHQAHVTRAED